MELLKIVVVGFPSTLAFWLGCKLMLLGLHGLRWAAPEAAEKLMHHLLDPALVAAVQSDAL